MATMNQLLQIGDLSPAPRPPSGTRTYRATITPVDAVRNIDCAYCYYLHKEELLVGNSKPQISDEILETHSRRYI
jgi:sulfatase maturation enzyme AslB (radical SAM superfamily)